VTQSKELRLVEYPVTLMEREDADHRVELVYNGPKARQAITIHVYWHSGECDQAIEAFHHPYVFEHPLLAA
jgi:hypothetical protein